MEATIIVGPARAVFKVSMHFLINNSPFFENAFQGEFKEATTKVMKLPEDESETFARYLAWAREQRPKPDFISLADRDMEGNMKILDMAKLWIFAEKVRVFHLQNTVMNFIVDRYHNYTGANIAVETFNYVFENTVEGSQLRRVFVDFATYKMNPDWYKQHKSELHVECIEDLCLAQMTNDRFSFAKSQCPMPTLSIYQYRVAADGKPQDLSSMWQADDFEITGTHPEDVPQKATPQQLARRKTTISAFSQAEKIGRVSRAMICADFVGMLEDSSVTTDPVHLLRSTGPLAKC